MKNKTKKELTKEVNALKKALKTKKVITFADVKNLAVESGKKAVAQAEQAGADALKKVEGKIVEKFNETSGKAVVKLAETAFTVTKTLAGWKKKAQEKLKR
ncbi:MAG: hypothetical protein K8R48_09420 [Alphaproteobacteria bacterium]|nr:hypothetical protein [Alphaproteobacteria bacterium]